MFLKPFRLLHYLPGILCCILIWSCKEVDAEAKLPSKETISAQPEEESNPESNYVVLSMKTDDQYGFKGFTILDYSRFYGNRQGDNWNSASDSTTIILKDVREPRILEFFNMTETHLNSRFLVSPGDTIALEIKNGEFIFSGKNAAHYNFYAGLGNSDYARNPFRGDLMRYKAATREIYNRRKAYFEDYVKENPEVSEAFKDQVSAELRHEYLYNLVAPRTQKAETLPGIYGNDLRGLSAIFNDTRIVQENLLDLRTYFEDVQVQDLQRPELVNNDYFKRDLVDLIRHYFAQNEVPGFTAENFQRELEFINNNLDGQLRKVATGKLIWQYQRAGFGRGEEDRKFLKKVIADYKEQPLPTDYREEISNLEDEVNLMSSDLPDFLMQDRLIDLKGDTITLGEVLDKSGGKIKYLDFWATWCPPCIADFKASRSFKERLSTEENISFIYISVEKETGDWKEKSGLLADYIESPHQYKLVDPEYAKVLSFLKIRDQEGRIMVPRYTVLDNEGKISAGNAPRLADSVAVKELLKILQ